MTRKQQERLMTKHVMMLLEASAAGDRTAQLSLICMSDLIAMINRLEAANRPAKLRRRSKGSKDGKVIDLWARRRMRSGDDAA
jgi:hypothetical protein